MWMYNTLGLHFKLNVTNLLRSIKCFSEPRSSQGVRFKPCPQLVEKVRVSCGIKTIVD